MANSLTIQHILLLPLPIFLIYSGVAGILVKGQAPGQGAWCISRPSVSEETLLEIINYACKVVDCKIIQAEGPCFYPTNLVNHASVVMNLYYQKLGRHYRNCNFNHSGLLVVTDPSYGDCKYEYANYMLRVGTILNGFGLKKEP